MAAEGPGRFHRRRVIVATLAAAAASFAAIAGFHESPSTLQILATSAAGVASATVAIMSNSPGASGPSKKISSLFNNQFFPTCSRSAV